MNYEQDLQLAIWGRRRLPYQTHGPVIATFSSLASIYSDKNVSQQRIVASFVRLGMLLQLDVECKSFNFTIDWILLFNYVFIFVETSVKL